MTHCPWCGCVWTGAGELVDPRPENWARLPLQVDSFCQRLEAVSRHVPQRLMPMTREEMANAGIVRKGRKLISVRRTLDAVTEGRSCLPAGDRGLDTNFTNLHEWKLE
jgi:hypothetical protein